MYTNGQQEWSSVNRTLTETGIPADTFQMGLVQQKGIMKSMTENSWNNLSPRNIEALLCRIPIPSNDTKQPQKPHIFLNNTKAKMPTISMEFTTFGI